MPAFRIPEGSVDTVPLDRLHPPAPVIGPIASRGGTAGGNGGRTVGALGGVGRRPSRRTAGCLRRPRTLASMQTRATGKMTVASPDDAQSVGARRRGPSRRVG